MIHRFESSPVLQPVTDKDFTLSMMYHIKPYDGVRIIAFPVMKTEMVNCTFLKRDLNPFIVCNVNG